MIDMVATTLWPFLCEEKREQFLVASRLSRRETALDRTSTRAPSDATERAWAAGFFDGEGSVTVGGGNYERSTSRQPSMEIPQSSADGVPDSLVPLSGSGWGRIDHGSAPAEEPVGKTP